MTIAACYLTKEGVVLGADSTSTIRPIAPGQDYHFFNHHQKLFELGNGSTVGILTWGLGSFEQKSYRGLLATLWDSLETKPATSLTEVAHRLSDDFWHEYHESFGPEIQRCRELAVAVSRADRAGVTANSNADQDRAELQSLSDCLAVGFCVAGHWLPDRTSNAIEISFDPTNLKPIITPLETACGFWGVPTFVRRLFDGADYSLRNAILDSGHWSGSERELDHIFDSEKLSHATLPIRDAIDFVHTCIAATISALKFSEWHQVCGGPIELAVITSDRPFRWVTHKSWSSSIKEFSDEYA